MNLRGCFYLKYLRKYQEIPRPRMPTKFTSKNNPDLNLKTFRSTQLPLAAPQPNDALLRKKSFTTPSVSKVPMATPIHDPTIAPKNRSIKM